MQHKQICLSIQNSYHEEWVIVCKDTRKNVTPKCLFESQLVWGAHHVSIWVCSASVLLLFSYVLSFLFQLQHEKAELEQHLEQEQEFQVNKLMKKIKKLENDTISKQLTLEQVPSLNILL